MRKILISERGECSKNVLYILGEIMAKLEFCKASSGLRFQDERTTLVIEAEDRFEPYLRDLIVEKISEVICIAYKYKHLNERLGKLSLSDSEREILLAELIAADLAEDAAYVSERLSEDEIYQFDGFFAFRMHTLQKKWERICESIPPSFRAEQLADFIGYVMEENSGMLYVKGTEIYNESYQKLNRAGLIATDALSLVREIILSGAKEVFCLTDVSDTELTFLQKYYSERVYFA